MAAPTSTEDTNGEVITSADAKLDEIALVEQQFRMGVKDIYRLAVGYYREHEKSDLVLSYGDRLKLMAYSKQSLHGKYVANGPGTEAGWFDFIGNDRKQAWEALGDLSKEGAMAGFVSLLDRVCPPFKDFVDTHVQKEQLEREEDRRRQQQQQRVQQQQPVDLQRFEQQRRQIQEALNQQTYHQFRAYSEQQFPGNPEQQEALIQQLQEQHYQQYMAQVYAQQAAQQGASPAANGDPDQQHNRDDDGERHLPQCHAAPTRAAPGASDANHDDPDNSDSEASEEPGDDLPSNPAIAPASMWTRKDMVDFKNAIRKEGSEGVIKVGHGETVTVRVPTHEEGTCLFWEFCTDHYDIGFGVYFEWTIAESNQVSVHISESSDEEGEEELAASAAGKGGDVESGSPTKEKAVDPNKPQLDEIIPVYRRDCHEEVYAGSHVYPGQGVYLLKFDNSYSLWRSKTLYYRVYYSK